MKRSHLATALLLFATLSACHDSNDNNAGGSGPSTTNPASFTSTYKKEACSNILPTQIAAEFKSAKLECGFITVPANWTVPDGDTISLAVYRLPSTSAKPAPDPVIYLEGGPGGAGISTLEDFAIGPASYLRERSDVVVVDQRGTGYSRPALYCREVFQAEKEDGDIAAAHKACHDRLVTKGINLADYTSHNNALDINAVPKAMGYTEWNLYGLSYGTRLALTVMRDAAEGVRSVVLDSVFPPQVNGLSEASYPRYWSMEQIARNCEADTACRATGIDLKTQIEQGIERLAANPVTLPDGTRFATSEYLGILGDAIANPEVGDVIMTIANGTDDDISQLTKELLSDENEEEAIDLTNERVIPIYPFVADVAQGMASAVVCAEEWPYPEHKVSPDLASHFSQTTQQAVNKMVASDQSYQCNSWDIPAAGLLETQAVNSDIPTLVLAGTADIATPPEWGRIADKTLSRSQYTEFPDLTHGVLGVNDCVNTLTRRFLDNPETKLDQSCIAGLPKVSYFGETDNQNQP